MSQKLAAEHESSVVTSYQLAAHLFEIYRAQTYAGQRVRVQKPRPEANDLRRVKEGLIRNGILAEHKEIGAGVYRYLARPHFGGEQIVCGVDPFAYVSHLSAMAHFGLTNHLPQTLFATTWDAPTWRRKALEQMESRFAAATQDYLASGLPPLRRISLSSLGPDRRHINFCVSAGAGSYVVVKERAFRVSSIGRTFLDMVRRPDLCGGMSHVMDVFEEHAKRYSSLIIDELNRHGAPIDYVRTGYFLEELCGVKDSRMDEWVKHAQRGGSRKLDPLGPYEPVFSPKWCISLNVIR